MLEDSDLVEIYRRMLTIRKFEEKIKNHEAIPNFGMTHLSIGQEATAVGSCFALNKDDYIATTHRGHGHLIAKGADLESMMAEIFGKETGYCGGKSGSLHLVEPSLGILGANGIVGAWNLLAVGGGLSSVLEGSEKVCLSFGGDGSTNIGLFHEAVNLAALWDLPVVFICENNRYAFTTPQSEHTNLEKLSDRAKAYDIPGRTLDGNDVLEVYEATREAVDRARKGEGPAILELMTYRWRPHVENFDPETYRTEEEKEKWKEKDPINRFREGPLSNVLSNEEIKEIEEEVEEKIERVEKSALAAAEPSENTVTDDVFAPEPEELSEEDISREDIENGKTLTCSQALNEALREELERDESVFLLGEDIRYGGSFGVTEGLAEDFDERVLNTPISENAIIGGGTGAAMTGKRPVVEIMFSDFLFVCMDPIANQASKWRYMSDGGYKVPIVIRTPTGGGGSLGPQHSQSIEPIFMQIPGIKVVTPSNPYDSKGLMKTAIRSNNPVIFFEHKILSFESGEVPEQDYTIPFGSAEVKREGEDVTLVTVMVTVGMGLDAADSLEEEGIEVEVIDLRTLSPLDKETIIESVKKTGRLVVAEESCLNLGVGAEITSIVTSEAFNHLEAPVERVASPNSPVPYANNLEEAFLPDSNKIEESIRKVLK